MKSDMTGPDSTAELDAEVRKWTILAEELDIAVFEWNLDDDTFKSSKNLKKYAVSEIDPMVLRRCEGDLSVIHPDDIPMFTKFLEGSEQGTRKTETVLRLKMKDGTFRWCRMFGIFIRSKEGRLQRIVGAIVDVDREKSKSIMMESLLNALPGGIVICRFGQSWDILYMSESCSKLFDWTRGDILEMTRKHTFLKTVLLPEDHKRFIKTCLQCSKAGEPIEITVRFLNKDGSASWAQMTAVKIRAEQDGNIYYSIITKPSEEASLYKTVVDDAANAVFIAEKKDRRIIYTNKAWFSIEGVNPAHSVTGKELFGVISTTHKIISDDKLASLPYDNYTEFHVTGSTGKCYLAYAKSLWWNGVDAYIIYFIDESDVNKSRLQMRSLLDKVPTGIGIYEVIGGRIKLNYISDGFYRLIGGKRSDRKRYFGFSAIDSAHCDDKEYIKQNVKTLLEGKDTIDMTFRLLNGTGSYTWMRVVGSVIERSEDKITVYCSFSDVDRLMRLQNEIKDSRALLNAAIEAANVSVWEYYPKTRTILRTEHASKRYGFPRVTYNVPESMVMDGVIDERSADDFVKLMSEAAQGKTVKSNIKIHGLNEKKSQWVHIIYTPIFDAQGGFIKSIGTSINITEQKEREEKYEDQINLRRAASQNAEITASLNLTKNTVYEVHNSEHNLLIDAGSADDVISSIASSVPGAVSKADFDRVMNRRRLLVGFDGGTLHFSIRHQIGKFLGWFETSCDLLQNPYTGDAEAFLMVRDVTNDKMAQDTVNKLINIDYDSIFTCDAKSGQMLPSFHGTHSTLLRQQKDSSCIFAGPDDYIEYIKKYCPAEEQEKIINENNLKTITKKLKECPVYITNFTICCKGAKEYKRCLYCYLDDNSRILLAAVQDITEMHLMEERQKIDLRNALAAAKQANEAKSDFLSNMSHEIRTPMNAIIGMTKLAQDEVYSNPESVLRYLRQIDQSSLYLLGIINDILDMRRIESNKFELHLDWARLEDIFKDCIDMIRTQMKEKGIEFTYSQAPNVPVGFEFMVDGLRTKQMIMNLLNNAYKFTAAGGRVTITLKQKLINDQSGMDFITITDTGCGMSEEFLLHIFEPFTQEKNVWSRSAQGTGLGLAISQQIAKAMGGDITVQSRVGYGSAFCITYPFKYRIVSQDCGKDKDAAENMIDIAGCRILLAEDHPLNASIAVKLLEKRCMKVDLAVDGRSAAEMFKGSECGEYDAVLMDIRMPVLGGIEATRIIRGLDRADAPLVPIIAMTANAFEEDIKSTQRAGMNAHLSKPIEPDVLYKTLEREITKYRGQDKDIIK